MAYQITARYTRPSTNIAWPIENSWQTNEQIAERDRYFNETYLDTGKITSRSYTESEDLLTMDVHTEFCDQAAQEEFLDDFTWWNVILKGRYEYMEANGITKEITFQGTI